MEIPESSRRLSGRPRRLQSLERRRYGACELGWRPFCRLTDLELSGAVAECGRAQRATIAPPRPLERLVMSSGHECIPPAGPTHSWWLRQRPQPKAALRCRNDSRRRKRVASVDCLKTRMLLPRRDAKGRYRRESEWMREPRCDSHRPLPGDITDPELSGAPQLATREAECCR